jgi:hypothetical protein
MASHMRLLTVLSIRSRWSHQLPSVRAYSAAMVAAKRARESVRDL